MNWKELWMTLWGTTEWLGLNMGFWMAFAAVLLIVILMNILFWSMKPKTDTKNYSKKKTYKKCIRAFNRTKKEKAFENQVFSFLTYQQSLVILATKCMFQSLYSVTPLYSHEFPLSVD